MNVDYWGIAKKLTNISTSSGFWEPSFNLTSKCKYHWFECPGLIRKSLNPALSVVIRYAKFVL